MADPCGTATWSERANVYPVLLDPPAGLPTGLGYHIGRVLRTHLRGRDTSFIDHRIITAEKRPGAALLCEALIASSLGVTDVLRLAAERAADPPRRGEVDNHIVSCPAPLCEGQLRVSRASTRPGRSTAPDHVCRDCGTRFTDARVTFSFDAVPGYPPDLARRNEAQLAGMRRAVRAAVRRRLRAGERLRVEDVLDEAQVPASRSYRTSRAGLVEIIDAAATSNLYDLLDEDLAS